MRLQGHNNFIADLIRIARFQKPDCTIADKNTPGQ